MSKTIFYSILIMVLLVSGGYFLMGKNSSDNSGIVTAGTGGDYQKVTLSIKNYNYYPNTVTVKANEAVRIYLDESVVGCYRSFVIREFGIAKNFRTSSDYVEFTPTKPGRYGFACSMGMGTGTLIVE